jgi:hypothetical protein
MAFSLAGFNRHPHLLRPVEAGVRFQFFWLLYVLVHPARKTNIKKHTIRSSGRASGREGILIHRFLFIYPFLRLFYTIFHLKFWPEILELDQKIIYCEC